MALRLFVLHLLALSAWGQEGTCDAATGKNCGGEFREEKDTMGVLKVPAARYWGAQTQRSVQNFEIDTVESTMPRPLISALGVVKRAAAIASRAALEKVDKRIPEAIVKAANEVIQ